MALAKAGATLAVTSRTGADLEALAGEVGSEVLVAPGSVDDSGFADDCVRRIVVEHGRLDVLINCAGISPTFKRSELNTDEEWRRVLGLTSTEPTTAVAPPDGGCWSDVDGGWLAHWRRESYGRVSSLMAC
jgi:NAD(P)-dependent dehydrogenase (short-subunit alcohol dehydrogenase family)